MQRTARLSDLQDIDSEIDRVSAQIKSIDERLGETDDLVAARAELAEASRALQTLERERRDLHTQADDVRVKRRREEDRLYHGHHPPRETATLQHEVDQLGKRLGELEDRELEVMASVEECEARVAAAKKAQTDIESSWLAEQESLRDERDQLIVRNERLIGQRAAAVKRVDPSDLHTYEGLRRSLGTLGVARIHRGLCSGCRVSLSSIELQHAKTSQVPVQCGNCRRILFAG